VRLPEVKKLLSSAKAMAIFRISDSTFIVRFIVRFIVGFIMRFVRAFFLSYILSRTDEYAPRKNRINVILKMNV
jgi:hypothetical protein